jgi:arylsulfatase A-like enzyme
VKTLSFFLWVLCCGLATAKPNIVSILIDDMGWGDLGCFGNAEAKTPNIDRLAAEGLRFRHFYVNSPICSPSRCALVTGQYPQRWKITSFLNNRAENERRGMAQWLDPEAPTLAKLLKAAGYATGHFGKWHLGGQRDVTEAPAITQYGFDESLTNFEGMGAKLLPLTQKPGETTSGKIWEDAERLGGPATWMPRSEITGGFVKQALTFLKKATDAKKPFFLNVWPDDVHAPFWPPTANWGDGSRRRLYLSVLEAMDRQLGELFTQLRENEALRENTMVVLFSDNGPDVGAGTAGPFRGTKATLYEGGVRSPLIVWAPGLMEASKCGTWNETNVLAAMDLVPSLLKLAAVDSAGAKFDGENASEILLGKSNQPREQPIYWRRPPDRKVAYGSGPLPDLALREGPWKLLCAYDGSAPELYDVVKDPGETQNVASQNSAISEKLRQSLLAWHAAMPADKGPQLGPEPAHKPRPKKNSPTTK